jgi:hypothetical protein
MQFALREVTEEIFMDMNGINGLVLHAKPKKGSWMG